jgi:hypothetical protein
MKKSTMSAMCLGLMLGFAATGCGDDDDDKKAEINTPGADVTIKKLSAAGAAAPATEEPTTPNHD